MLQIWLLVACMWHTQTSMGQWDKTIMDHPSPLWHCCRLNFDNDSLLQCRINTNMWRNRSQSHMTELVHKLQGKTCSSSAELSVLHRINVIRSRSVHVGSKFLVVAPACHFRPRTMSTFFQSNNTHTGVLFCSVVVVFLTEPNVSQFLLDQKRQQTNFPNRELTHGEAERTVVAICCKYKNVAQLSIHASGQGKNTYSYETRAHFTKISTTTLPKP